MAHFLGIFLKGATQLQPREAARLYVERGLAVYPADGDKRPLIRGWNAGAAARDPEAVERYFNELPEARVGIATGLSEIVVLDVDRRNGGEESLRKLVGDIGPGAFESCPVASTPSGGQHIYYHASAKRIRSGAHVLGRGIDIRARGGGVLAPPSKRSSGEYAWRTPGGELPDFAAMPTFPDELAARIAARRIKTLYDSFPKILERGNRNESLYRLASQLGRCGVNYEMMLTPLLALNQKHCTPPLPEEEVRTIAESAAARRAVDSAIWFRTWAPLLETPNEYKVAAALSNAAEFAYGPLTPATITLTRLTGLPDNNLYRARKKLAEIGAIEVISRGRNRAAEISLLLPESISN